MREDEGALFPGCPWLNDWAGTGPDQQPLSFRVWPLFTAEFLQSAPWYPGAERPKLLVPFTQVYTLAFRVQLNSGEFSKFLIHTSQFMEMDKMKMGT